MGGGGETLQDIFTKIVGRNSKVQLQMCESFCRTTNVRSGPVACCGCETWSDMLREEQWLVVFVNRVFRGCVGLTGDWSSVLGVTCCRSVVVI